MMTCSKCGGSFLTDFVCEECAALQPVRSEPDPNTHEAVVQHERWGVAVYVPRWWAGKRVRVTLLEGGIEACSNARADGQEEGR